MLTSANRDDFFSAALPLPIRVCEQNLGYLPFVVQNLWPFYLLAKLTCLAGHVKNDDFAIEVDDVIRLSSNLDRDSGV